MHTKYMRQPAFAAFSKSEPHLTQRAPTQNTMAWTPQLPALPVRGDGTAGNRKGCHTIGRMVHVYSYSDCVAPGQLCEANISVVNSLMVGIARDYWRRSRWTRRWCGPPCSGTGRTCASRRRRCAPTRRRCSPRCGRQDWQALRDAPEMGVPTRRWWCSPPLSRRERGSAALLVRRAGVAAAGADKRRWSLPQQCSRTAAAHCGLPRRSAVDGQPGGVASLPPVRSSSTVVVAAAARAEVVALKFAAPALQADKEVVRAAARVDGRALAFASRRGRRTRRWCSPLCGKTGGR